VSSSSLQRLLFITAGLAVRSTAVCLALCVGCMDSPEADTSQLPQLPQDWVAAKPKPTESTPPELEQFAAPIPSVADEAPTDALKLAPEPTLASKEAGDSTALTSTPLADSNVAEPFTMGQIPTEPTLFSTPLETKPTPVADVAALGPPPVESDSAIPASELSPSLAAPFPLTEAPTVSKVVPPLTASLPTKVEPAGQPAENANSKPLELTKPKGLIHISPKSLTPLVQSKNDGDANQQASNNQAALSPPQLPEAVSTEKTTAPENAPSQMTTELNSSQPQPTESKLSNGVPVSPISISTTKPQPASSTPPEGFTALFNNQDLTGWEVIDGKPESWKNQNGEVSCVSPGGGWLQSTAMYSDFELQFEYRLSSGSNSGVAVRYPGLGNPSLQGLEIQLLDDRSEKYQTIQPQQATGSLYFVTAPKIRDAAHEAGQWNHCVLRCVGQQLQVRINEQLVNEIDLSQINTKEQGVSKPVSAIRSPMGTIALQSHSTRVDFRNVNVRDFTQAMESGVRWLDLVQGSGEPVPPGAKVTVHYIGHLSTGKRFANSIEKGKPAHVLLKDVIPGWREGIPGMKIGGKRRLIVPAEMAYGAKGFKEVVPPNSTLVYEVELISFEQPTGAPLTTAEAPSAGAQ